MTQWRMPRPDDTVANANVCILHDSHVVLHVLQIAGLQRNHPMLRIQYVLL